MSDQTNPAGADDFRGSREERRKEETVMVNADDLSNLMADARQPEPAPTPPAAAAVPPAPAAAPVAAPASSGPSPVLIVVIVVAVLVLIGLVAFIALS